MAAFFSGAQHLLNSSAAVLDYPITVGLWCNVTALGGVFRTLWCLADTATADHYLLVRITGASAVAIIASAGGSENEASVATPLVAGKWTFVLARFISSSNRKVSVLHPSGLAEAASAGIGRSPTGLDTIAIGATVTSAAAGTFWDGSISEVWYTNSDIQGDGAALQEPLLRQLAYGGPFSVPRIAKDVVEYRSFRVHHDSRGDRIGDIYHGAAGRQTWSNSGVTIGAHPPLPYWYLKPGQNQRALVF